MELKFQNLSKNYGKIEALKGVSFTLTNGVHGLLGPNGAGKSTLMNILSGNLAASGGEILYDGTDILKLGDEFRKELGYMPQQQALYPDFTAARFLSYMASLRGMSKAAARKAVPRVLQLVGLTEAANRRIKSFSGGMKQRLLIAQAILNDPKVLILDEPTAGLDPKQRIAIRNLISSISENKIVLISTHVVADIACIAKDLLILKEGSLLRHSSPAQLLSEMQGKVWERNILPHQVDEYRLKYRISNVSFAPEGFCIRILSEQEVENGNPVRPNLEDVYLNYFEE